MKAKHEVDRKRHRDHRGGHNFTSDTRVPQESNAERLNTLRGGRGVLTCWRGLPPAAMPACCRQRTGSSSPSPGRESPRRPEATASLKTTAERERARYARGGTSAGSMAARTVDGSALRGFEGAWRKPCRRDARGERARRNGKGGHRGVVLLRSARCDSV